MSMRPLLDVSPAGWIVEADADWWTTALYGPPGFPAYVRVRFDMDGAEDAYAPDLTVMQGALDHLRDHTTTPDDGFVGIWHGWGFWEKDFHPAAPRAPHFAIPNREYVLLGGPLGEALTAASLGVWPSSDGATPHFVWPTDHAWCIASDVDPDWFAVGGPVGAIDAIMADERLDAVPSTYAEHLEIES
jgi:hypothetical protein